MSIKTNLKDLAIALSVLLVWIPAIVFNDEISFTPAQSVLIVTFGELVLLIPVLYFIKTKKFKFSSLGLRKFKFKDILTALGLWVIVFIFNAFYAYILSLFNLRTQVDLTPFFKLLSPSLALLLIFGGGIIAPFVEEIYFRGFLYNLLKKDFSVTKAAIIGSIIFSLVHIFPASLWPIFVLGILFTVVYEKSNSLWPSIILHSLNNLLALSSVYFLSQL